AAGRPRAGDSPAPEPAAPGPGLSAFRQSFARALESGLLAAAPQVSAITRGAGSAACPPGPRVVASAGRGCGPEALRQVSVKGGLGLVRDRGLAKGSPSLALAPLRLERPGSPTGWSPGEWCRPQLLVGSARGGPGDRVGERSPRRFRHGDGLGARGGDRPPAGRGGRLGARRGSPVGRLGGPRCSAAAHRLLQEEGRAAEDFLASLGRALVFLDDGHRGASWIIEQQKARTRPKHNGADRRGL
ncbi:unnamed protein product, partial [Prorocentrum cordatum]